MNCKNCNAELEEGATTCPACGAEVEQKRSGKTALLVVLVVAAVAVIVALIYGMAIRKDPVDSDVPATTLSGSATEESQEPTIPADGNPDDVTCKGSYTVSDEELLANASNVVAKMDGVEMNNEDIQIYYWMQFYDFVDSYSSYLSWLGLDVNQSLDTQVSPDGTNTWQQYFLDNSISAWHSYQALNLEAQANNFVMDEEYRDYLDGLPATLNDSAVTAGFENAEEMLQADMGSGATLEGYLRFLEAYYNGYLYYNQCVEQITLTDEEVEAYFNEHEAEYTENGLTKDTKLVDVRHILLTPEGGTTNEDGSVSYSEEEWEACRGAAQQILDEFLAGEQSEERFGELANLNSVDGGSNTNGGLYTNVYVGQMVEPFETWCFDENRFYGETGLVQTPYGYHIMFFVESKDAWYETAWSDLVADRSDEIVMSAMEAHPMEVDYSAIYLGAVDFTATK